MFSENLLIGLLRARRVLIVTGAGISAESGIATFRDAQTGLWERYNPHVLATPEGYESDRALVWGWYEWRRMQVLNATPNAGHLAVAQLADYVEQLTLVTQNVDDLHERAGSKSVVHLHGSLHHPKCSACAKPYEFPQGIPSLAAAGERVEPPRCEHCNGYIRPGVVWFGETLPEEAWEQAQEAALECDVIFSIGTSSLVWPAAKLPDMAIIRGAKVIQINPGPTSLDSKAHYNFNGTAGEVLPALIQALSNLLD